jgi:hypothetical protein
MSEEPDVQEFSEPSPVSSTKEGWVQNSPTDKLKKFIAGGSVSPITDLEAGSSSESGPSGRRNNQTFLQNSMDSLKNGLNSGLKSAAGSMFDVGVNSDGISVMGASMALKAALKFGSSSLALNSKSLRETLESSMDDETIDQDRMAVIRGKLADEAQTEDIKEKIIMIKYATDPSYFSESTPDEIWESFKRREAWEDNFMKMVAVTVVQFLLCVFPLIGENAPMTSGTMFTTFLYVLANLLFTEMMNANRLLANILALLEPYKDSCFGLTWYLLVFVSSPFIAVGFFIALAFDFAVGDVHSASYARFFNDAVAMFVKCTSISVGLRSPTPLAALASFVGFSYITDFDELVVAICHVDLTKPLKLDHLTGIEQKVFNVQVLTYTCAVVNYAVVTYFTVFNNNCLVYCDTDKADI